MLRLAILLIVGLPALAGPASAQTPADSVRMAFEAYRFVLTVRDGDAALDLVDTETVADYTRAVDFALDADSSEVAALPLIDQIVVLSMRQRAPTDSVRAFDGARAFAYAVSQGWTGDSLFQFDLDQIQVDGTRASATVQAEGVDGPLPFEFHFRREAGWWRLRLVPLKATLGGALRESFRPMLSEMMAPGAAEALTDAQIDAALADFMVAFAGSTDEANPRNPWRPLGR